MKDPEGRERDEEKDRRGKLEKDPEGRERDERKDRQGRDRQGKDRTAVKYPTGREGKYLEERRERIEETE